MTTETSNPLLQKDSENWKDWKWQQKNSLCSANQIKRYFPNFPQSEIQQISQYEERFRWRITPYTLSLMNKDSDGNPYKNDPLVRQFFPVRGFRLEESVDSYHGRVNWEIPDEMPTRLLHHKYPHKAILRLQILV